jgi:hypothetical protein
VGLEENGEIQKGKEEDLATRAIEAGKKGILVDLFVGVKEDKTLLTTACGRANVKHDWGGAEGRKTDGGTGRRGRRQAANRTLGLLQLGEEQRGARGMGSLRRMSIVVGIAVLQREGHLKAKNPP